MPDSDKTPQLKSVKILKMAARAMNDQETESQGS
jgi:hypothetical protein